MKKIFSKLIYLFAVLLLIISCDFNSQKNHSNEDTVKVRFTTSYARMAEVKDYSSFLELQNELVFQLSGSHNGGEENVLIDYCSLEDFLEQELSLKQGEWTFTLTAYLPVYPSQEPSTEPSEEGDIDIQDEEPTYLEYYTSTITKKLTASETLSFQLKSTENALGTLEISITYADDFETDDLTVTIYKSEDKTIIDNVNLGEIIADNQDLINRGDQFFSQRLNTDKVVSISKMDSYVLSYNLKLQDGSYFVLIKSGDKILKTDYTQIFAATTSVINCLCELSQNVDLNINIGAGITAADLFWEDNIFTSFETQKEEGYIEICYTDKYGNDWTFKDVVDDYSFYVRIGKIIWKFGNVNIFEDGITISELNPVSIEIYNGNEEYEYNAESGIVYFKDALSNSLFQPVFKNKYATSWYFDEAYTKPVNVMFIEPCWYYTVSPAFATSILYSDNTYAGNKTIYVKYSDAYDVTMYLPSDYLIKIDEIWCEEFDKENNTYSYEDGVIKVPFEIDTENKAFVFKNILGYFQLPDLKEINKREDGSTYLADMEKNYHHVELFDSNDKKIGDSEKVINANWDNTENNLSYSYSFVPNTYTYQYRNPSSEGNVGEEISQRIEYSWGFETPITLPDYSSFEVSDAFTNYHFYGWYVTSKDTLTAGESQVKDNEFADTIYKEDILEAGAELTSGWLNSKYILENFYIWSIWEYNGNVDSYLYYYKENNGEQEKFYLNDSYPAQLKAGLKLYAELESDYFDTSNITICDSTGEEKQKLRINFHPFDTIDDSTYFDIQPNSEEYFTVPSDWAGKTMMLTLVDTKFKTIENNWSLAEKTTISNACDIEQPASFNITLAGHTENNLTLNYVASVVDGNKIITFTASPIDAGKTKNYTDYVWLVNGTVVTEGVSQVTGEDNITYPTLTYNVSTATSDSIVVTCYAKVGTTDSDSASVTLKIPVTTQIKVEFPELVNDDLILNYSITGSNLSLTVTSKSNTEYKHYYWYIDGVIQEDGENNVDDSSFECTNTSIHTYTCLAIKEDGDFNEISVTIY